MQCDKIGQVLTLSTTVVRKAQELERLSRVRRRLLGKGEMCRGAACVELACRLHKAKFEHADLIRYSGASPTLYNSTLFVLQNLLNVHFPVTVAELAVKFGCVALVDDAEALARRYRRDKTDSVNALQAQSMDFATPLIAGAALSCVASLCHIRLTRAKLFGAVCANTAATRARFADIVAFMNATCVSNMVFKSVQRVQDEKEGKKKKRASSSSSSSSSAAGNIRPSTRKRLIDAEKCEQAKKKKGSGDEAPTKRQRRASVQQVDQDLPLACLIDAEIDDQSS
jgi:ORC6 second cyclin-like domain/Origin recognition complex subunit 6 (ORC6)